MDKKFPDLKFFSLILAEKPLFFPDFPDWKKSSKFSLNSLISLIGGNPVFRTFLANGGKLEDFPISDTESESDSDTVEMKSIQVVKVIHPELRKVTQECEDGTKRVDKYLMPFKMCTEQKDKGSTTSKDVVYKI